LYTPLRAQEIGLTTKKKRKKKKSMTGDFQCWSSLHASRGREQKRNGDS